MSETAFEQVREQLGAIHQEQLLRYYDGLNDRQRAALLLQLQELDFSYLSRFHEKEETKLRGRLSPIRALTLHDIAEQRDHFFSLGLTALKKQEVAAVILAGGMGTRLGSDHPKGCFDIGITKPVYIFERLIANLLENVKLCGAYPYLFVMTSDANDEETRCFLAEHAFFGYDPAFIRFFKQEMAPAVDGNGKVLLASKWAAATSPNGNGGWFRSMARAGFMDFLKNHGVRYVNVFNVDNVLQKICDPLFVGAVIAGGYASGSIVVRKNDPFEKLGVMCLEDGHASVIEYTELSRAMCLETDESGNRVYDFGAISNYLFRLDDLCRLANASLPLHFAHKKVPCIGEEGELIHPDSPNAWKFEYFIFDILRELKDCLPFEVRREESFAPVKNRSGIDSVETAQALCRKNGIVL